MVPPSSPVLPPDDPTDLFDPIDPIEPTEGPGRLWLSDSRRVTEAGEGTALLTPPGHDQLHHTTTLCPGASAEELASPAPVRLVTVSPNRLCRLCCPLLRELRSGWFCAPNLSGPAVFLMSATAYPTESFWLLLHGWMDAAGRDTRHRQVASPGPFSAVTLYTTVLPVAVASWMCEWHTPESRSLSGPPALPPVYETDTTEVFETATGLWEPDPASPLSRPTACLEAARSLCLAAPTPTPDPTLA